MEKIKGSIKLKSQNSMVDIESIGEIRIKTEEIPIPVKCFETNINCPQLSLIRQKIIFTMRDGTIREGYIEDNNFTNLVLKQISQINGIQFEVEE